MAVSIEQKTEEASGGAVTPDSQGGEKLPPMLTQYLEYKRQYPECVIFFQVGDFYEIFFEDAVTVSRKLNLTLTSRDKSNPNPVPMCGVPQASVDGYVERLVALGFSAALVTQINGLSGENAGAGEEKEGPGKMSVQRKLTRIVTPGVRILSNLEDSGSTGPLVALVIESEHEAAFAYSNVQSGILFVREGLAVNQLFQELKKLSPSEILLPGLLAGKRIDRRNAWVKRLEQHVGAGSLKFRAGGLLDNLASDAVSARNFSELSGYASFSAGGRRAVRILVEYLDETLAGARLRITEVRGANDKGLLSIDATTRQTLELTHNTRNGGTEGTLFHLLNRSVTTAGERLLRQWLLEPLTDKAGILSRQRAIAALKEGSAERSVIVSLLKGVSDLERIAARTELGIVQPRELGALRDALAGLPQIQEVLKNLRQRGSAHGGEPVLLENLGEALEQPAELSRLLAQALAAELPMALNEGGVIRRGFNAELDQVREVRQGGKTWMEKLEAAERVRTGIGSLKIKFNYVLGYFIEITRANLSRVPSDYIRRQSTANSERFTTGELKAREAELLGAEERERQLEKKLFEELRLQTTGHTAHVRRIAAALSTLDVLQALAEVAEKEDYVLPAVDESHDLFIKEGRHPVLAKLLQGRFVPNSLSMRQGSHNCYVITGPNMGGKSTYLRQAGLIVILAQMGAFVPAREARVGIVDKVFARIGASDNIAEGESTFMVEMREAAHIINGATARSLLLVDEIGRGTATSDGLAIAQAILEWIVGHISARTLFATHYHELTALENLYPTLANLSVGSVESGEDVVFTHEICGGAASKSYGVEVAKLASLPAQILQRAKELLTAMTRREMAQCLQTEPAKPYARPASGPQLALFGTLSQPPAQERLANPPDYAALKSVQERLLGVNPDKLTPLEALILVHELVEAAKNGRHTAEGVV